MNKNNRRFWASGAPALIWLAVSIYLAIPWLRDAARSLPDWYAGFAIAGIALLPGYLTCAMFACNLLTFRDAPPCAPPPGGVTVVVCARNEARVIAGTLRGILAQTYPGPVSIVCVDNASSDGTYAEMARVQASIARPDRRMLLLKCAAPGKAHALNAALTRIDTDVFVTVDADTRLAPGALRAIVGRLRQTGAACAAGNLLVHRPRSFAERLQVFDYLTSIAAIKRYQGAFGATLVAQGAFSAYDTAAVRSSNGWTQGVGEDIVLTYRLLAQGRSSVYEPRAVAHTVVPPTLRALGRQRIRWAQGMFEGFAAVPPWRQGTFYGAYFETLNLSVVYLDLAFLFGFWVGVALLALGRPVLVGPYTLLLLPLLLLNIGSVYAFQRRVTPLAKGDLGALLAFLLLFQTIQSICSLIGYARALTGRPVQWK